MTRFEKTVKGLESIHAVALDKEQLYVNNMSMKDFNELLADALELLKEREALKVLQDRECEVAPNTWQRKGFCPECHQEVQWIINRNFCGFCGQAVKWE